MNCPFMTEYADPNLPYKNHTCNTDFSNWKHPQMSKNHVI